MRAAAEKLPEKYRQWLEEVDLLITDEELTVLPGPREGLPARRLHQALLGGAGHLQGDGAQRVPGPLGGLRRGGADPLRRARRRPRPHPPAQRGSRRPRSSRAAPPCSGRSRSGSTRGATASAQEFVVVFYRRWGAGPFRIWNPLEGLDVLFADTGAAGSGTPAAHNLGEIANGCRDGDQLAAGIGWVANQRMGYAMIQSRIEAKPEGPGGEWVASFGSYSTDVPEGAALLNAKLDVEFPGRHQNRTVIQGLLTRPGLRGGAGQARRAPLVQLPAQRRGPAERRAVRQLPLQVRLPGDAAAAPIRRTPDGRHAAARLPALPAAGRLHDDRQGWRTSTRASSSAPSGRSPSRPWKARAALPPPADARGEGERPPAGRGQRAPSPTARRRSRSCAPPGELQTGMLRFDTLTTGDIASVTFALDGKPVLTKKKPPYSVELDLGSLPRPRRLTVTAFDVDRHGRSPATSCWSTPPATASRCAWRSRSAGSATRAACSPASRPRCRTARRWSGSRSSSTRPGWRRSTSRPSASRSSCPRARRSPTSAPSAI